MNDYLHPHLSSGEIAAMSSLGLAHVGDAVFELMVRTWLTTRGTVTAKRLHSRTVAFVSAKAQARSAGKVLPCLDEEEFSVFKRGRNAHVNSVPRGSTYEEYHTATGIETLFGYLYLSGRTDRLQTLFEMIVEREE
ncbi:MAG: ribonuclease III [Oscillospiraceae bacterium]|nr:ribonuclease III [Oscillospiraceae bacterium]